MGRCLSHPASQSGRKKRQKEIKLAAEVTRLFIHKVRRAALDKPAKVLLCWDILEAEQKLDYVVGVRTDGARGDFPSLPFYRTWTSPSMKRLLQLIRQRVRLSLEPLQDERWFIKPESHSRFRPRSNGVGKGWAKFCSSEAQTYTMNNFYWTHAMLMLFKINTIN